MYNQAHNSFPYSSYVCPDKRYIVVGAGGWTTTMFGANSNNSRVHGNAYNTRRVKPIDVVFLTATFVMGMTFGSYIFGGQADLNNTPQV